MFSEESVGGSSKIPSIFSPDLKIVGDLKSTGDIQIDGSIEGLVEGRRIIVGEQGRIEGSIVAEAVRISGTVNGQVQAKSVHLDKAAKVTADIAHETLTIEAGAYFEGRVQRLESSNPGLAAAE